MMTSGWPLCIVLQWCWSERTLGGTCPGTCCCHLVGPELEAPPWDLADKLGITNSEPTRGQIKSHMHQLYCSFDHSRQIYSMTPCFISANLPSRIGSHQCEDLCFI